MRADGLSAMVQRWCKPSAIALRCRVSAIVQSALYRKALALALHHPKSAPQRASGELHKFTAKDDPARDPLTTTTKTL